MLAIHRRDQRLDSFDKPAMKATTIEKTYAIKKRYFFELDSELDDPYKQVVRYAFPHLYSREMSLEEERILIESITAKMEVIVCITEGIPVKDMIQVKNKLLDSNSIF